ncbi:RluA family pseudouridine synthase [Nitrospina gracilis]|uniref:RluA family pseudouridine synthase n=1 Tax=Nitrospina gracilis TaxID=35801 RepID=UPI001F23F167|nr:RluA family pseudouridine synthase [Nitrospina gracilis]MCF8721900.1 23S rRNA pseudouridine1911/1915/1917 synthase [Nitrospina gracilis Nb-211]
MPATPPPASETRHAKNRLHTPPPQEQIYACHLPGRYIGYTIEAYFCDRFPYFGREEWERRIVKGRITVNGLPVVLGTRLKEHDYIITNMGVRTEPPADRKLEVVYEDEHIRALNKGAPLPVHPSGRYFQNSMTELLRERYPGEVPRPVQRLDATTTGLVVFAKTREAAYNLSQEFTRNRVHKEYLALVAGKPKSPRFVVDLPVGKVVGSARGVGPGILDPKPAVTVFECLAVKEGASLIRAVPHTGRTNQIRVHLASVGLPILNDEVYGKRIEGSYEFGLHAYRLAFNGPDRAMELTAPWPDHFQPFIEHSVLTKKTCK